MELTRARERLDELRRGVGVGGATRSALSGGLGDDGEGASMPLLEERLRNLEVR